MKNTLMKNMKKLHYILILLALAVTSSSTWAAQVRVNGTTYSGPLTGVTASTTTDGNTNAAVYVSSNGTVSSGSLVGANGWNIWTTGSAPGIYVYSNAGMRSFFSGSNLSVTTSGFGAIGVYSAYASSTTILVSSTVNASAYGLYAFSGGSISGTDLLITASNRAESFLAAATAKSIWYPVL